MDLSTERLQAVLRSRPFEYYPQIGSTNDRALEWLRDEKATGAVFIADEQIKGRGRLGRSWFAPPDTALMISVALRPPHTYLSRVNMLAALSVLETIQSAGGTDVGLKWPNDVLFNGRKVCGVLSEAAWDGEKLLGVALGIGLNVRIDFTDTPFEATATSLEPTLASLDRAALLVTLLARIDHWVANINSDSLFEGWKTRLAMLGKPISVLSQGSSLEGIAEEVDPEGALLVRDHAGVQHRVIAADIAQGR
jgi:BirA family transcriptional regulator, biotin operon repressor / biotin---[acetyl-CoA-carboxylase] ligase